MRDINLGTGKSQYGGNTNIIILDDSNPPELLYGHHHMNRIEARGEAENLYFVNGIELEAYVAFMKVHYPNHWASKALTEAEIVTNEILKDISNEITLSEVDANYLAQFQEWVDQHPEEKGK